MHHSLFCLLVFAESLSRAKHSLDPHARRRELALLQEEGHDKLIPVFQR